MHAHVEGNNFVYDGKADIAEATKAEKKDVVTAKKAFWADVAKVGKMKGDVAAGEAGFATCMGCHTGMPINMGGVIAPADHKYEDTSTHPMGSIKMMMTDDQQIADVVAYMMAKKAGEVTTKEAFAEACGRCHAMRYAKTSQLGDIPKFKYEKDTLSYKVKILEEQDLVKAYMGKLPPDLSMINRARSHHFMETFVENPQSQMAGTSMPRVGLSKAGYAKVEKYMEEIGDPSKPAREELGPKVILFFIIFTGLAFLWKKSRWKGH
jgi:ubiquinol-cytochrome c reductase cytochrome c1 subunit